MSERIDGKECFSTTEAAAELDISLPTLYKWLNDKDHPLDGFVKFGRRWFRAAVVRKLKRERADG